VIAPSFADIFFNNSGKNGILLIRLPTDVCRDLAHEAGGPNHRFTVDLAAQTLTTPSGQVHRFDIDPGRKAMLMSGLDEIGQSLTAQDRITQYETGRRLMFPWLDPASA